MFGTGRALPTALGEGIAAMEAALDRVPADDVASGAATATVEALARLERRLAAYRQRVATVAVAGDGWRRSGARKPEEWLARATGGSVGQAVEDLETAERLKALPTVASAAGRGDLSPAQAAVIARAASKDPSRQAHLVDVARSHTLKGLKEACRKVHAPGEDDAARHAAIHRSRHLRTWTDEEGAFCLRGRFTPEAGAVVKARLERMARAQFDAARREGRREEWDAYQADALVELCGAGGSELGPSAMRCEYVVLASLDALRRGHVTDGETCEILNVGPIPVPVARALLDDAFLKAVITDGDEVRTVAHFGRHVPARLRTAILVRDRGCAVPGCDVTWALERDHAHDFAAGGATSYDNLRWLCAVHHDQKTHRGFQLLGTPGQRRWVDPDGRIVAHDPAWRPTVPSDCHDPPGHAAA